jgi:hypothetical protein
VRTRCSSSGTPKSDRVELSIRNLPTGLTCQIEVAPGDALDAFYHPFAYAARCDWAYRLKREGVILDR